MKVLFDHQAFEMQTFGGVSKCFCELIANFPQNIECQISIKKSNNLHLIQAGLVPGMKPAKIDRSIFVSYFRFRGAAKLYNFLSNLPFSHFAEKDNVCCSVKFLERKNFDVFHPTFFNTYFLDYLQGKPFVLTVHDMMPEIFPQYFRQPNFESERKKMLCEKASAIVAVSHKTKEDLVRIMGVSPEKITVIHHGGPNIDVIAESPIIAGPYFLYVGQRNAYKNFKRTLQDFAIFSQKHNDVKFVFSGKPFSKEELQMIMNVNLSNRVIYQKCNDAELKNLYKNAIAFIYPSLYEGFGMPILEAFAYGCPCLLNNKSCFPEVGGDAAIYFDSDEMKSDLANQMTFVYNMPNNKRNELICKGLERLQKFSWKKSSIKLSNLYYSLV